MPALFGISPQTNGIVAFSAVFLCALSSKGAWRQRMPFLFRYSLQYPKLHKKEAIDLDKYLSWCYSIFGGFWGKTESAKKYFM